MKISGAQLYKFLTSKCITHLYHANTVSTSITFVQKKGLLFRGAIYDKGLTQTPQNSDSQDKRVGVWYDVFLDTQDLHKRFKRQNHYGPVLFKFSIAFLRNSKRRIRITKDNPIRWSRNQSVKDGYFSSTSELNRDWTQIKAERKMITIRSLRAPILFKYLTEIILDNPGLLVGDVDIFEVSSKALRKTIKASGLRQRLRVRKCGGDCWCLANYYDEVPIVTLRRYFDPMASRGARTF